MENLSSLLSHLDSRFADIKADQRTIADIQTNRIQEVQAQVRDISEELSAMHTTMRGFDSRLTALEHRPVPESKAASTSQATTIATMVASAVAAAISAVMAGHLPIPGGK